MSIILDALKKAETERHLGALPGLHTPAAAASESQALRSHGNGYRLWIGIVGVIALGASIATWWLASGDVGTARIANAPPTAQQRPLPSALQSPITAPIAAAQVIAPAAPSREIPVPPPLPQPAVVPVPAASAASAPTKTPSASATATSTAAPTAVSASAAVKLPPASVPVAAQKPTQSSAAAQTTPASPAAATSTERIIAMSDLSPALQRELPPLVIGGSMYSDNPAERMLLIDKRLLHEGDEVAPGLVLEKLMPKEAVLRLRGTRFRINF